MKINKEIQRYQESILFGLSLRQMVFALLAIGVAIHTIVSSCRGLTGLRIYDYKIPGAGEIFSGVLFFHLITGRMTAQSPRIRPLVATVCTCQGINFPLRCSAVFAACSMPPQQGTSIRTMVRLRISFWARMAVSFSV